MSTGQLPDFRRISVRFALILVAAAGLALGSGCSRNGDASAPELPARPMLELTPGEVAVVERRELVRRLPVSGSLAPMLRTVVKSKVPGEILEVAVREGMSVKAGEALMLLDTRSLAARVASMRASV
jgi:multidrug efflux pump subunit AcrA (membrane-fusion protein)